MPGDPRQARILAMQALCQWDVQGDETSKALDGFLAAQEASKPVAARVGKLVQGFWGRRQSIDDRIAAAATNWDLSRISPVERNVMRVAVVELLSANTPPKVALNEAIEIGREFGGENSPRFINGVLDVVFKRQQRQRKGDG
jgi:N utilization substance protein B